jgi:hypothetical protein
VGGAGVGVGFGLVVGDLGEYENASGWWFRFCGEWQWQRGWRVGKIGWRKGNGWVYVLCERVGKAEIEQVTRLLPVGFTFVLVAGVMSM